MKELWFASNNQRKMAEYKDLLANSNYDIKYLEDLPEKIDIPEDQDTFEKNALFKAEFLSKKLNKPVVGDDSGLCIQALGGFPGVKTRRWSYPISDNVIQNRMLLEKIEGYADKTAYSVSAIAYVHHAKKIYKVFVGKNKGVLKRNDSNYKSTFGYDSIFFVPELNKFYCEMTISEKNKISHRAKAFKQFKEWLNEKKD